MDEIRLESYSKALIEKFPDDVDTFAVLERLSNQSREEFEPIIPAKADLIVLVKKEDWARRRKAREAREAAEEAEYRAKIEAERAAGEFEPMDVDVEIKKALAKREAKQQEPVTHATTTEELGNGAFRQTCTCGKKWETIGPVPTCMGVNAKQHARESLTGIVKAKETAA